MRITTHSPLLLLLVASPTTGFVPSTPLASRASVHRSKTTHLHMSVPTSLDYFTSAVSGIFRFHKGVTVDTTTPKPKKTMPRLVQLYDVENDSACRAVRERITELDLNVEKVIPAAPNSRVFSQSSYDYSLPVGAPIPRLVVQEADNSEHVLVGDADIVSYLNECANGGGTYNDDDMDEDLVDDHLGQQAMNALVAVGGFMSNLMRLGRGCLVSEAASPDAVNVVPRPIQPLILYSYENNQFCRLVREVLTELDIVYELRSVGKHSQKSDEVAAFTGNTEKECPFLMDPNTGVAYSGANDIIPYLYRTYALWTPANEVLQGISNLLLPWVRPILELLTPLQAKSSSNSENGSYQEEIAAAKRKIQDEVALEPVVIYTYGLSPFCMEATKLLDNLDIDYKEISLGGEWIPGFIGQGGSQKRAALLELTGQSSLPNVFIGGKSIGGLFSGTPGLVPALERGLLREMVENAVDRMIPSADRFAAAEMAKPASEFEKLTTEKLQRALNMTTDSNDNGIEATNAFW